MTGVKSRALLNIQLHGDPSAWSVESGQHARVTFWWHDVPLGHCLLDRAELPIEGVAVGMLAAVATAGAVGYWTTRAGFQVAADMDPVSAPIATSPTRPTALPKPAEIRTKLDESLRHTPAATPSLTVVVCTRERPVALTQCIIALNNSTAPPDAIIVVDNAPASGAARDVVSRFPHVVYVVEPRAGLSHARNTGMDAATTELVAFTDDDVEVTPSWTARIRQIMSAEGCDALTGLVLPAQLSTEAQLRFEEGAGGFGRGYRPVEYHSADVVASRYGFPVWQIGAGANMALRRAVFERVGPFDTRLGAGAAGCSEDSEWWYRLLAQGGTVRYDPRAVVLHHHRSQWKELSAQKKAYMEGHVAALIIQWRRHGHFGNIRRLFSTMPRFFVRRAVYRMAFGGNGMRSTWWAEVRGSLRGLRWFIAGGAS